MTDERPAEPKVGVVVVTAYRAVKAAVEGRREVRGEIVWSWDSDAVEAAARLMAIEYAESRVRAMCPGQYWTKNAVRDELAALARLKSEAG